MHLFARREPLNFWAASADNCWRGERERSVTLHCSFAGEVERIANFCLGLGSGLGLGFGLGFALHCIANDSKMMK